MLAHADLIELLLRGETVERHDGALDLIIIEPMLLADPALWGGLRNLAFWSWVGKNSPVNSVPGDFLFPDFTFPGAGPLFSLANSDHKREFIIVQHRLRKHCTRTFGRFTKW